ncbi:MAG: transposase [Bacteroidetes bacterium]|nr:transposase [Bacteroidota bacterium]
MAEVVLAALRFLQAEDRLTLYAYVLMVNHLHLIAEAEDLAREIAAFKSYTARRVVDCLTATGARSTLRQLARHKRRHKKDRTYQVWQEGSHPQQIQGRAMLQQKLAYVHANPVRRGYVDDPVHWRYSSARVYAGHDGVVPVTRVD